MSTSDIVAISSVVVVLLLNLYQNYKMTIQMKLQMFAEYTKRYQDIVLNLPTNIFYDDYSIESEKNNEIIKKYLLVYFDLCSEEYYLYLTHKIDKEVWKEWESGIKENFRKQHIVAFLKESGIRPKFYSKFTTYLKKIGVYL